MIIGDPMLHSQGLARLQMTTLGKQWLLTASPRETKKTPADLAWKRGLGWLLSATLTLLIVLVLNANARRTSVLKALADSQQRFTRAFETAPQGMALLDVKGFCLDANDALCQLLGYTRDELHDNRLPGLVQVDSLHAYACSQPNSDSQAHKSHELRLTHKSGEAIDCMLSSAVVEVDPPYMIVQIQDLREHKRLDRMQREFVSTVSHELRTPLTSITGSLGLIVGGALGEAPAAMRQILGIAHQNCLRLGQLINDLLDMDKLIEGKMQIDLRVQPLQPLLQETISNNQPYAEKFGVSFALEGRSEVLVEVDGLRLQQVLANFLTNAAKFSPHGSTVNVKIISADNQVRVTVQDYGPGIPDSFKDRIFQKFSQADSSDTRTAGGTGLGLAISKRFIELMGGHVGFESEVGSGSTFWFELPRHRT